MKMAKASEQDLSMALDLNGALDALGGRWPTMPSAISATADNPSEPDTPFDRDDDRQCGKALRHLLEIADRGSLMRVVFGCSVMLDPRNQCVDPAGDTIAHHPDTIAGRMAKTAKPLTDWTPDAGPALWWTFPITSRPFVGSPLSSDWPGIHTHWTPLTIPLSPTPDADAIRDCAAAGEARMIGSESIN